MSLNLVIWTSKNYFIHTQMNTLVKRKQCSAWILYYLLSWVWDLQLLLQETQVQSLGQEDPQGKGMAMPSSILAWRIPWIEESRGLQSWGCKESDRTEGLTRHFSYIRCRLKWKSSVILATHLFYVLLVLYLKSHSGIS